MAKCPNCQKTLHFWNAKAECPHCHINIPNHNWEERLEEDAQAREAAFFKLYSNLTQLKFSVVGTTLRIVRFVFAVLPILGFVIPWGKLSFTMADGTVVSTKSINAISFFTNDTFKLSNIISLLTSDTRSDGGQFALIALVLAAAALAFGVVAFLLIPILSKMPKTPIPAILHCISTISMFLSPYYLNKFIAAKPFEDLIGDISVLAYIGGVLFLIAFVLDVLVSIKQLSETDGKYIPKDELQREYAISIGAISE